MLSWQEPILHCLSHTEEFGLFSVKCADRDHKATEKCCRCVLRGVAACKEGMCVSQSHEDIYAVFSGVAMLLYWLLLINFSIFSMQISAFVLVCGRVLTEVFLFLLAALFLLISFATAIAAMNHSLKDFSRIDKGMETLLEMTLSMYPNEALKEVLEQSLWVEICIVLFTILISVVFLNLLVAQLNQAYSLVHEDMHGYARLTRGSIIVSTVEAVSRKRWKAFLAPLGPSLLTTAERQAFAMERQRVLVPLRLHAPILHSLELCQHLRSLSFDQRLEFNEGDIGLSGRVSRNNLMIC